MARQCLGSCLGQVPQVRPPVHHDILCSSLISIIDCRSSRKPRSRVPTLGHESRGRDEGTPAIHDDTRDGHGKGVLRLEARRESERLAGYRDALNFRYTFQVKLLLTRVETLRTGEDCAERLSGKKFC